jgi:hypothetical protein
MDLEQKVQELRQRIDTLRASLEVNNTCDEPRTVQEPKPSAADLYKARLMKKTL